jgi:steroid delta-isomerase-like uncharacterized protein
MQPEDNKAVVRRFYDEVVNGGHLERADEFVTPTYIEHQQLPGAEGRQGIQIAKAFLSMMRAAFPDYRLAIEDLIAEGDRVVARVVVIGTHRGEMMGLAPTGETVRTSGVEIFRFDGNQIAEHWATFDALGMLRQIGMTPVPGPPLLARTLVHLARKRLRQR